MTENKQKHLAVWIIWLVFHLCLLFFHWSWGAFAVLAVAALILLLTTFCSEKYEDGFMYQTMGNLLGCSAFVQLGWYVAENVVPKVVSQGKTMESFWLVIGTKWEYLQFRITRTEGVWLMLLAAAVCFLVRLCAKSYPKCGMLASYLGNLIIVCWFINAVYDSKILMGLYVLVTLVCVYVDLWPIQEDREWRTNTKRWLNILSILMFMLEIWDSGFLYRFAQIDYLEHLFVVCATKWYYVLLATIALAALAGVHIIFDTCDPENWLDVKYAVGAMGMLYLVLALKVFYIGCWWMLILAAFIYLLVDELIIYKMMTSEEEIRTGILVQLCVFVMLILIAVIMHFGIGRMILHVAMYMAAGFLIMFLLACVADVLDAKAIEIEYQDYYGAVVVTGVILIVLSLAAGWIRAYRNLGYSKALLIALAVVCIAVAWLFSYGVYTYKRKSAIIAALPRVVAVITFVAAAITLCCSYGSKIQVEQESQGYPAVTAEARGEDNRIVSREYYWTPDWLDLENLMFEMHEETEVVNLSQLKGQDGKLRVVVTDQYGIQTETVFWVHETPQFSEPES